MAVGEQPDLSGATPPLVGGYNPVEFSPAAYVFHGGYHWLAEPLFCGGDMSTYPGTPTAVAMNVHRIDALGVDTVFPVELPIYFDWSNRQDGFIRDLCTVTYAMFRTGWHAGAGGGGGVSLNLIDAALASDGTTLWLGVVCKGEDPYPWYFSHYAIPYQTPSGLEATSAAGNYYAYQGSFFCGGSGSPWDDLGVNLTQRWQPYRLLMFSLSGGSFVQIGEVPAAYKNDGVTVGGDFGPGVSGVEMCASASEPGVCHAVWAETGQWGQRDLDPPDGFWPYRGSRLTYSSWSPGGVVVSSDLSRADFLDIGPYPPPSLPLGVGWLNPSRNVGGSIFPWAPPMTEGTFAFTPIFALRNDHGSPVLFISPMKIAGGGADLDNSDWQLRMWDVSGGVAAELQALTSDLLPQPVETQYIHLGGGGGFTVDRIPSVRGIDSTQPFFMATRKEHLSVSSLYEDPLLGGQAVYLVGVVFVNSGGAGGPVQGFYRVPCDGSGPFTVLDGDRNLAILPNVNHRLFPGHRSPWVPIFDFFSEAKSAWVPSGASRGFQIAGLLQLDRVCEKDWVNTELSTDSNSATCERSGVHYDPVTKKFYYASYFSDVGETKIVANICGPQGIHIWDLPPGHR